MTEIYWLTRLDGIIAVAILVLVLCGIALVIAMVYRFAELDYCDDSDSALIKCKKWIKGSIVAASISTLVIVFVPTKSDAIAIWGIGTTLDYVRSNEKINNLPDKAVDALDAWVDSLSKDKN